MKGNSICHQNFGMIQIRIPVSKICVLNNVSAVGFVYRKAVFKNEIDENKIAKSTKASVTGIIVTNLNSKAM